MKCSICHEAKPPEEFAPNPRAKSGRMVYCRGCHGKIMEKVRLPLAERNARAAELAAARAADPEWQAARRQRATERMRQYRAKGAERRSALKKELGGACKRCGFEDERALVFHHRDPRAKAFGFGTSVGCGKSMAALRAEAAKCDLLCANCHAIEHA